MENELLHCGTHKEDVIISVLLLTPVSRKKMATPEDIEYLEYQKQMADELIDTHLKVERIVSESTFI